MPACERIERTASLWSCPDWIKWETEYQKMYVLFTTQRKDPETHVTDQTLCFSDGLRAI